MTHCSKGRLLWILRNLGFRMAKSELPFWWGQTAPERAISSNQ